MTWSTIHEGGHALYELGIPSGNYGLPVGSACSLSIHESQSRLWENNVGRSLAYWKAHYANLQSRFPENLKDVSLEQFYAGANKVQPSLIRVDADELSYHLHILVRFELEKALIEGSLEAADVEEAWNAKYKEYLDIDVPDAKQGVLQDIHWSHGSFGYFPTYSLGSFYAAQFFEKASKDVPELSEQISRGENAALLKWLRENIHQHGRLYNSEDLCEKVTGEKLNLDYFMRYAKKKYGSIYGL
jgi:carboxypeptidase Taq